MSANLIVSRYSKALFETTEQLGKSAAASKELAAVAQIFSDEKTIEFFTSPNNTLETNIVAAKSSLEGKCSTEVFNFMSLLVENGRVALLVQINESYQAMVSSKGGETEGTLYVPAEVSGGFKAKVEEELSRTLHKKVKLKVEKDAALIAGFKATVGGWTVDDSAQFHLNRIKENVSKRIN